MDVARCFIEIQWYNKNPGLTNKYPKFGQLIIKNFIKVIATRYHILRPKCTKFDSRRLSLRPSVRFLDGGDRALKDKDKE